MIHYTPDGIGGFTSDKYFYHYDGRGNVTQLTNDSQNIVAKYTYDAFGNTTASGTAAELNQYR
jgi:YD repeat-containing protein